MSKKMSAIIVAYGVALVALAFVVRLVAPELARIPFFTGLGGGGLCVLCGLVAWAGHSGRAWPALNLTAIILTCLGQAVPAWLNVAAGTFAGASLLTAMLLLTVGMLIYVLHGERPPEFYFPTSTRPDAAPPHHPHLPARNRGRPAVET